MRCAHADRRYTGPTLRSGLLVLVCTVVLLTPLVVSAAGQPADAGHAYRSARPKQPDRDHSAHGGRLLVFGVPHYQLQQFPWYHVFREEIQINTSVGPECGEFFQTAADMVLDDRASALTEMVTPRMPWEKAPEAFEMYAERARGSLKLTLEV